MMIQLIATKNLSFQKHAFTLRLNHGDFQSTFFKTPVCVDLVQDNATKNLYIHYI